MTFTEGSQSGSIPETWRDLESWVRHSLALTPELEQGLFSGIEAVFARQERLWHVSKQDAMTALALAFADRMVRAKSDILARDRRITDISRHFEGLVAQLTDKVRRDPKTKLMNLTHFTERLEAFLAFEQRSRRCAVGMIDVAGFKKHNDTLGHAAGDQILDTVARLLREQVRDEDLLAREDLDAAQPLHGRFGGDEFCFMLSNLPNCQQGHAVADRFREAVARYDWRAIDERLSERPVRVDVGVVCLRLGHIADRRPIAQGLAAKLLERADELMYSAKATGQPSAAWTRVQVSNGELIDVVDQSSQPQA